MQTCIMQSYLVINETSVSQTMRQYVEKTLTPTILVCSNVTEGRYKPEDLETYLDPELLYSPLVFILQVNPVTKAKMKSCLKDILKKEGILNFYSDEWLEELHLKCGGDLRHAITNAQFQLGVLKRSTRGTRNAKVLTSIQRRKGGGDGGDYAKDVKLSTFHALGKLLYAKRVKEQEKEGGSLNGHWNTDQRPPLDFDPERVLEDGDIGITGALSFIQHHAPDFFTNIEELSCAFDLLSDGTFLLDGGHEVRCHVVVFAVVGILESLCRVFCTFQPSNSTQSQLDVFISLYTSIMIHALEIS